MNLSCNIHASSFVKGAERDEYDDLDGFNLPLGLRGKFSFVYSYPLSTEARFSHELTPEMTGEDILVLARHDYETIYIEEDEAVSHPGLIPGMLNRARSAGPYGIWGHNFSDLYFEGVKVDLKTFNVSFSMGS